ncbi:hypothetical protein HHK36_027644 [Tetracentron sinense]|uniref:SP-RING-type domain-containing protein n=1 Tax=Tetracentron sinense TaxID=13715 RepID=A0A834YI72_TETSI|nr:hypothetical protein HHK36_027644 [Tetracentron sinense]
MAGAIPQQPTGSSTGPAAGSGHGLSASLANSFRITAVAERLAMYVRSGQCNNSVEFFNLCLSLARGIDYAVAHNEVPTIVQDLPLLLKEVYQRRSELVIGAAIMVLMISAKNACKIGWFPAKDTDDLLTLANEIGSNFCSRGDANTEASHTSPTILKIMSRFYPRMKMGSILASLEVKPGYGAFVADFNIPKNAVSAAQEKIWLFIAQKDNLETSSCIISPPQVNFLLNGKGVDRRTNVSMMSLKMEIKKELTTVRLTSLEEAYQLALKIEAQLRHSTLKRTGVDNGPQFPTNVTSMLKYGTNLLQAVGQFNGHCIIIIAFMSVISSSDPPVLQDYVQPVVAALDSDSEIIEGPSRISLNCPISYRRIKTPVKGHLCKHHQLDSLYWSIEGHPGAALIVTNLSATQTYVLIRIWLRQVVLDLHLPWSTISISISPLLLAQVLREVGEDVADVIISADGSWKSVLENDGQTDQPHGSTLNRQQDGTEQCESTRFSNTPANVVDLTLGGHDESDAMVTGQTEDRKPSQNDFQGYSVASNLNVPMEVNNTYEVGQSTGSQIEEDIWSRFLLSGSSALYGSAAPSTGSDVYMVGGISESPPANFVLSPVLTDAVSPALNRESVDVHGATQLTTSLAQSQFSAPNNLLLQQLQLGNSIFSNEYGRSPSIPRHVSRTPIAIQALPAQAQLPSSHQRPRNSLNSVMPNGASSSSCQTPMAPITDGCNAAGSDSERQQWLSRSLVNPLPVSGITSSMQHNSMTQNWGHQDHLSIPSQSIQQVGLQATSQFTGAHRGSSAPHLQQPPNLRVPQTMTQSPNMVRPSTHFPPMQGQQGGAQGGVGQAAGSITNHHARARLKAAAQRAALIARSPPAVPVQLQASRTPPAVPVQLQASRTPPAVPVQLQASRTPPAVPGQLQASRTPPAVPVQLQASRTGSSFPITADRLRVSIGEQRGKTGGMVQSVSRADDLVELPSEQNWRPTGRMRGSLSGHAYNAAFSQFMSQPTQPTQADTPPSILTSPPANPSQLHMLISNSINAHVPPTQTYPRTGDAASMPRSSGILPERPPGMH